MTDIDRLCRTLSLALRGERLKRDLPQPFGELQTVTNDLSWLGVHYATAALLMPQEDDGA